MKMFENVFDLMSLTYDGIKTIFGGLGRGALVCAVLVTSPIWIIPYVVSKKYRENK